jgi:hypothetical protein
MAAIAYRSKARRGVISVGARRTVSLRRVLRSERRRPAAVVAIGIPICVALAGVMDISKVRLSKATSAIAE